MSAVVSDQSSDNITSGVENTCSNRVSAIAVKEILVAEHEQEPGLFSALCRKLLCRRDYNDEEDVNDACRVQDDGLCSLCCGGIYPRRSERHCTIVSNSKQMSVHWLPSSGTVEATTRQPGSITRRHQPRCSCVHKDVATMDSCEASASRSGLQNDLQPAGTLRRYDNRVSDSLHCSKPSATMRRVMLADAAYGHATVLDDCMLSDSDAWSGSLSLSRPNSGTNSLERGTSAVQENADEVYESYSDEGEAEEEVVWPAVMPLPALPVYDQVKDSSAGWSLASELRRLVHYGWYWGPITRVEAEEKLAGQEDGTFLVRDSSDDHYLLSLSFRSYGRTLHTRIEHCQGSFSLYSQSGSDGYQSIVELIERSVDDSKTGVFCYSRARALGSPSFPVRLTRAVSRFAQVRSLQYLCRFVIRQYTRVDHIQRLPLPKSIKGWLEERPY